MATMKTIKGKTKTRYQIEFSISDKRRSLSLGSKYTRKQAERIKTHVEETVKAIKTGRKLEDLSNEMQGFFADMTDDLRSRFIAAGLCGEEPQTETLAALWDMLDDHAEKMAFKEHTTNNYETARKWFFAYEPFTEERQALSVTEKDAEEFRAWLERQNNKYGKRLAPTTVAGIIKAVKTVFNLARRARLIDRSPFEFVQKGSFANPARQFEVSASIMPDILNACPGQGWRVLISFWRFGGLRKMEPLYMKWEDVFWDKKKFRVHSPKTERYEGHAERFCPLFDEVQRELEDLFEIQGFPAGAEYILPDDIRELSENALYNAVIRIIRRAGYTPWPKAIVNMRATRVSELVRKGATERQRKAWFGHSEKVSKEHYQQEEMLLGQADFDWACKLRTLPAEQDEKTTVKTTVEDAENARFSTESKGNIPVGYNLADA